MTPELVLEVAPVAAEYAEVVPVLPAWLTPESLAAVPEPSEELMTPLSMSVIM